MPHDLIKSPDVCDWFEWLYDSLKPLKSHYRCKSCFEGWDKYHLKHPNRPLITTEGGVLKPYLKLNTELISSHFKSPTHIHIEEMNRIEEAAALAGNFLTVQIKLDKLEDFKYQATSQAFRTIYHIGKKGRPLSDFADLFDLQRAGGIPMGLHFDNSWGAAKMLLFVSDDMHDALIDHILSDEFGCV